MSRTTRLKSLPVLLAVAMLVMSAGCGSNSEESSAAKSQKTVASRTEADAASNDGPRDVEAAEGVTAEEVLGQMVAAYQSAESYFDNALYHERFVQRNDGVPREPAPHQVSVVLARPNRFRLTRQEPHSEQGDRQLVAISDGARLVAYSGVGAEKSIAADTTAPESPSSDDLYRIAGMRSMLFPVPLENLFPQLDLLLTPQETKPRLLRDAKATLLPSKSLGDADCYRVQLARPAGRYVAWIDKESKLLRRLEMPTDEVRRELDRDGDLLRLDLWIDFENADTQTAIGPTTFQIGIPEQETAEASDEPSTDELDAEETADQTK